MRRIKKTWGVSFEELFAHSPDFPQDYIACCFLRKLVEPQTQEACFHLTPSLMRQCALNVKSTVLLSPAATVIFCVIVPSFSCHASTVYSPGGRFGSWKVPSLPVTAKYGCLKTAM